MYEAAVRNSAVSASLVWRAESIEDRCQLLDRQGQIVEMGNAVQSGAGSAWWNYTTQSPIELMPFPSVKAIAFDLPGK